MIRGHLGRWLSLRVLPVRCRGLQPRALESGLAAARGTALHARDARHPHSSSTNRFGAAGRILAQGLDLDDVALRCLFVQHPDLAKLSAEHVVASLVFLHEKCKISKGEKLAAVVRSAPELLLADVHIQLAPTLVGLHVLLPQDAVRLLMTANPSILLRELRDIQDLVEALADIKLKFEDLVSRLPRVSLCEASRVKTVYRCLQDPRAGPGMDHEAAAISILVSPELLFCQTENLGKVATFLRDVLGVDPASVECARFYALHDALETLEPAVKLLQDRGATLDDIRANPDVLLPREE